MQEPQETISTNTERTEKKQVVDERGIRRISSLVDAWWKIALILGSILAFFYGSSKAWIDIQSSIKQGQVNKDDIQFIKEHYATQESVKSVDDKVNKQYSTQGAITDRIIVIEKQLEYQRGVHDGVIQGRQEPIK